MRNKFHRTLTIDKVQINPFTLLATIRGLKLMEAQGNAVFVGFDSLTVKISPAIAAAPCTDSAGSPCSPSRPYIWCDATPIITISTTCFKRMRISRHSLQGNRRASRFYNIQVEDGRIDFDDKPVRVTNLVSDIKLGIPFISSLPSQVEIFVDPLLRANINGAPLYLAGKARPFADPKEATLDLSLDNIDLTHYLEYLPYQPQFKLPSARLDVHLSAGFVQPNDKAATLTLNGTAALKSLKLADMSGKSVLSVPELAVTLGKSNVFGARFDITQVLLDGLDADLAREKSGQINLQQMLLPGTATVSTAAVSTAAVSTATAAASSKQNDPPVSSSLQLALDDVEIHNATVHFTDLQAARPTRADLNKFDLSVRKTSIETGKRLVNVGEITSNSAEFLLSLGKPVAIAGTQSASNTMTTAAKPPSEREKAKAEAQYTINIDKIAIDNWMAHVEDDSLKKAVVTLVAPISFHVQNLSTAPASLAQIDLKATVNKHGNLSIGGKVGLDPIHTELVLNLDGIDLLGLQPYVTDQVNLLLTSANLSTKGSLKLDQGNRGWGGDYKGKLTLANVATVDKVTADDFLSWKSLDFDGINVQLAPLAVSINQIALRDFFSRVIIEPDGHINLQDIARSNANDQKSLTVSNESSAPPAPAAVTAAPPAAVKPVVPVTIGKLILQGGKVRYTDNVIRPHYTANLMGLAGTVTGLSSDAQSRANVDLHGQVNDAPLTIAGAINPLKGDLSLDLKADERGMELAQLSPYSGRYVGYGIEKGKLSFEVAYQIDQRKLTAENRLILDQLTFGDKIESPVATKLPVLFAVALLKDRNGVIDINLPISGSLDSPDFSVGGIIVKVLVNLVAKAVTSPFALLGSMFGGGEELSSLPFDPGSFAITPAAESKLKSLATALTERPALKLDIAGVTDADQDRSGLQRATLDNKVRAIKLKDAVRGGTSVAVDSVKVSAAEYPALLARAYKVEKFSKPRNVIGLEKDLPVPDMEKLMLANIAITNEDLTALGTQRALAAKEWLTTNGKVPAERLYILAAKTADTNGKQERRQASPKSCRPKWSLHCGRYARGSPARTHSVTQLGQREGSIHPDNLSPRSKHLRPHPPRNRRHERRCRNRQYPRQHDITRDTPTHGRHLLRRADADDGASDGMRGGNRHSHSSGNKQRNRSSGLGAKSAHRFELGDLLAHGFDDAPATEQRAHADRRIATDDHPQGHTLIEFQLAAGNQQHPDDADGLLCVVAAVAQAVHRGRQQLHAAKPLVDAPRRGVDEHP